MFCDTRKFILKYLHGMLNEFHPMKVARAACVKMEAINAHASSKSWSDWLKRTQSIVVAPCVKCLVSIVWGSRFVWWGREGWMMSFPSQPLQGGMDLFSSQSMFFHLWKDQIRLNGSLCLYALVCKEKNYIYLKETDNYRLQFQTAAKIWKKPIYNDLCVSDCKHFTLPKLQMTINSFVYYRISTRCTNVSKSNLKFNIVHKDLCFYD